MGLVGRHVRWDRQHPHTREVKATTEFSTPRSPVRRFPNSRFAKSTRGPKANYFWKRKGQRPTMARTPTKSRSNSITSNSELLPLKTGGESLLVCPELFDGASVTAWRFRFA